MRLVIDLDLDLDLDLDRLPNDQGKEAGRILRFWASALPQMELTRPVEHALMDSHYRAVGSLHLLDVDTPDAI